MEARLTISPAFGYELRTNRTRTAYASSLDKYYINLPHSYLLDDPSWQSILQKSTSAGSLAKPRECSQQHPGLLQDKTFVCVRVGGRAQLLNMKTF